MKTTVWDDTEIAPLLPTEKKYGVVKLNTRKPPFNEGVAVKEYEVDGLEEASTPDLMDTVWMAYDADGDSQVVD